MPLLNTADNLKVGASQVPAAYLGDVQVWPSGSAYQAAVLADSPLVYWRLGESSGTQATDSSGNGRHGTYGGTHTKAVTGLLAGDSDTAVSFADTPNLGNVSLADASWMNVSTGSFEAWISTTTASSSARSVFTRYDGITTTKRSWILDVNNAKARFVIWAGGAARSITGATSVNTGAVFHLVGTYDGSYLRLYVNGSEDATAVAYTGSIATPSAATTLYVAQRNEFLQERSLKGTVDEVAMYSGALSSSRVAAHYAAGT